MSQESAPNAYPVTARNRVRRVHERGSYDRETVWSILDSAFFCHVAYVIDGQPFVTPTTHWRVGDRLFWHGSSAGRMLESMAEGAPVCVTVSHLDGLVLARSAFNHSVNYRSAMCFGTARRVDDPDEKAAALTAMIDRFWPGRAATLRPMKPQEIKATMVIAMTIDEASAKIRAKGVGDDEADLALPIWAGVVPLAATLGPIAPSPNGAAAPLPAEVAAYGAGRRLDEALVEAQRTWEKDYEAK